MKLSKRMILLCLLIGVLPAPAADTLQIALCDEAVMNLFGDIITLSRREGSLRRYVDDQLVYVFSGTALSNKLILQEPLRPVLDEPDKIYVLDAATAQIIAWDRFLNVHTTTPLHDDIISPAEFTVTSEHDWLIYDDFYNHIVQIHPNGHFPYRWSDKPVSGDIHLYTIGHYVLLYLKDYRQLRICDNNGTTLSEYLLPDSLDVLRMLPLNMQSVGLVCENGVYLWKPKEKSCRYLSTMQDVIFMHAEKSSYTLINRQGTVITIP